MDKITRYSFPNMVSALATHKRNSVEGFGDSSGDKIIGLSYGLFMILLILSAALWITALVLLIKHINHMPTWAVVLAIIFLLFFTGGPIITILLTMVRKDDDFY